MGYKYLVSVVLMAWLIAGNAVAASLYKWVDEDGNVTYQDTPPPKDVEFEETELRAPTKPLPGSVGAKIEAAALEHPVSLYTVPDCDSCDLVRLFLERRSIPFAEKDVKLNTAMQQELLALTEGLTVPTTTIGSQIVKGFNKISMTEALERAGFPGVSEDESNSSTDADSTSNN